MLTCILTALLTCSQPSFPWHLMAFHPNGQYGYWARTGDGFSEASGCLQEAGNNPNLMCVKEPDYA